MKQFQDRFDAGLQLSRALSHLKASHPIVLGLARGGMEVASVVAKELGASLDVLVARKVGAPAHPEYGIGAVAPGGVSVFDRPAVRKLGITEEELRRITAREEEEVERRLKIYRGDRRLELAGQSVIIVDDGLATGITALAALRYVHSLRPRHLVFAVPVSSTQGAALVKPEVDEFVSLQTPDYFYAVGAWYEDFGQTDDQEVLALLAQAGKRSGARSVSWEELL